MNTRTTDIATRGASTWLSSLACALAGAGSVTALFHEDCYWRDLVAFTWNIITLEGHDQIADMLRHSVTVVDVPTWQLEGSAKMADGVVAAWFTFETNLARGRGHVRLRDGKCWTLFTRMSELKGFEERSGRRRDKGSEHHPVQGFKHWPDIRKERVEQLGYGVQPYCLVIGGGQSGIILAARLGRLNVPTLVVDRGAAPGDVWRNRYKSLYLHDPVWFDHLPYVPFPDDWPIFAPAQKMGEWLNAYSKIMELNYWHSTDCQQAVYDAKSDCWTVKVARNGEPVTLRPRHVVIATGLFGTPKLPEILGEEEFLGNRYHTSERFDVEAFAGKRCVVVGANSSGHDMAVTLWEHKADVTMLQRSSTIVVRSSTMIEQAMAPLYSEEAVEKGISADMADDIAASIPHRILPVLQIPLYQHIRQIDAAFYERLRRVGYKFDFGQDETGITAAAFRGRGFYIDVGGADLIASGKIKLKGSEIDRFTERSVVLTDGSELPADLVVFATGYGPMNTTLTRIFGRHVSDSIGRCWGVGANKDGDPGPWEGEIRNMWKPLAQPNLWIMAGNFAWGRYYSRFLALQIKARMEGVDGPVYAVPDALRSVS